MVQLASELTTPLVADACVRLEVPLRAAPPGVRAVRSGMRGVGRALPVRHYGSVDVFLEAYESARPGDVLVIDNGGRTDEACVGDLAVLEARAAGLAGMVVWGLHRDTAELADIRFPVFSYGAYAIGPLRLDEREPDAFRSAVVGSHAVTTDDVVFADDDGVLFVPADAVPAVLETATHIYEAERRQADLIRAGRTLREQTAFADYLDRRDREPTYTFRRHLRSIGGAIEE
jgi:regulator of RNase E activity RraA